MHFFFSTYLKPNGKKIQIWVVGIHKLWSYVNMMEVISNNFLKKKNPDTYKRSKSHIKETSLLLSFFYFILFYFLPEVFEGWTSELTGGVPEGNIRHQSDLARVAFRGSEQERTLLQVRLFIF